MNSILTRHIDDGQVDTAQLAADAVDGTKIADDAIDSEHYAAASIDTAHIANDQITAALIADNAINNVGMVSSGLITADLIASNAVGTAEIAGNAVAATQIAANAVNASELHSGALSGQTMTGNVTFSGNVTTQGTNTWGNSTADITNNAGKLGIQDTNPPQKFHIDEVGGMDVGTGASTATTVFTLDSFAHATFRTAKYFVQITNSTDSDYQALEIVLFHDGSTVYLTQFASIFDNGAQAAFDADISGSDLRLRVTPASGDTMAYKFVRTTIEA